MKIIEKIKHFLWLLWQDRIIRTVMLSFSVMPVILLLARVLTGARPNIFVI